MGGLFLGVALAGTGLTAWAAEADSRVFDQAGLFEDGEEEDLEELLEETSQEIEMDLAVVTAFRQTGTSAQEYADDFYDENGIGEGFSGNSGALYLIYMDGPGEVHGDYYISAYGDMVRLLTDERLDRINGRAVEYLADQDYAGAARVVAEEIQDYARRGIQRGQYEYDTDRGLPVLHFSLRWYEILISVGLAAMMAVSTCLGVVRSYGMKQTERQKRNSSMAYQAQCRILSEGPPDRLINQFVTHHRISHSSGRSSGGSRGRSSTHRSSSGRRHGGRGGRF